jgi:hypothetical protein
MHQQTDLVPKQNATRVIKLKTLSVATCGVNLSGSECFLSDLVLLGRAQMRRIEPFFPRSRGLARVDDRRLISGIIYVIRNGLQWKDARAVTTRTNRSTIVLSVGAGWGVQPHLRRSGYCHDVPSG